MKHLLIALALLLPFNALADRKGSPFPPKIDQRFDAVEDRLDTAETNASGSEGASLFKRYAKAVYDVAVDGGESTEDQDLGITIPAGAVITSVLVYVNTLFTDSGTGSVKLECKGSGDLMEYRDMTALLVNDALLGGMLLQTGTAGGAGPMIRYAATALTTYDSILTACSVIARVRGDSGYVPQTAGKLTVVIEYFMK